MKNKFILLLLCLASAIPVISKDKNKGKEKDGRTIFVEEFRDRRTDCMETYEYYKTPDGRKIPHGKYRRQWSLPKGHPSNWSGQEMITATFVDGRLNGLVVINCDKRKWKRKNEVVKGGGRDVKLVEDEVYRANNLKLVVKNDTLCDVFNFELGNYRYEATGKINDAGELQGKYTLYKKNKTEQTDKPKGIGQDWIVEEQYLCDPEYTYKDAVPVLTEIKLGYSAMSRSDMLHIKIPRLRLSITRIK
ncbi:hypothetical protein E2605_11540 [Dysgonomonas capnocytophagoides]|uniref:Uncharacterized protein n=1 Tax=Dysgonomonas capnocytophagoides TaxID=45254 RepID=A0A4Y8L1S4_9BACT|nr:hypothetical protein [Dysgonomonas capnocytophagoides]TFD96217.1 hypothetical protein E2605_11540 [Dysgonomonas capnocytophagoides]